ncbi:unnamed protein product [Colias eurytheme]|nr:unnamed protein product [Colias eurytheme]
MSVFLYVRSVYGPLSFSYHLPAKNKHMLAYLPSPAIREMHPIAPAPRTPHPALASHCDKAHHFHVARNVSVTRTQCMSPVK